MENNLIAKQQYSENSLYKFAYCGTQESFNNMLQFLTSIAEEEKWENSPEHPYDILRYYIFLTFERCKIQNKFSYSPNKEWCCINTGLLDIHNNDILMVFEINRRENATLPWMLKGFKTKVDREYMDHFTDIPSLATYTDDFADYYFNPECNIEPNYEHILDDHWDRISTLVNMDKEIVKHLLVGVIENTKQRVKRNSRLVVPQFYNNKIMYLMPISIPIGADQYITMALAVEKTATGQYRANTIFTKEDAYKKARLLMKPEANWLIED